MRRFGSIRLPRFRLGTLLILLTLCGAYLACWGPTVQYAVPQIEETEGSFYVSAAAPLIVASDGAFDDKYMYRKYYIWCFGFAAEAPWQRKIPMPKWRRWRLSQPPDE